MRLRRLIYLGDRSAPPMYMYIYIYICYFNIMGERRSLSTAAAAATTIATAAAAALFRKFSKNSGRGGTPNPHGLLRVPATTAGGRPPPSLCRATRWCARTSGPSAAGSSGSGSAGRARILTLTGTRGRSGSWVAPRPAERERWRQGHRRNSNNNVSNKND